MLKDEQKSAPKEIFAIFPTGFGKERREQWLAGVLFNKVRLRPSQSITVQPRTDSIEKNKLEYLDGLTRLELMRGNVKPESHAEMSSLYLSNVFFSHISDRSFSFFWISLGDLSEAHHPLVKTLDTLTCFINAFGLFFFNIEYYSWHRKQLTCGKLHCNVLESL